MSKRTWPDGWEVWDESEAKLVVAYRPDVFDGQAYPAPCLPTLYLTKGRRRRKPGNLTRPDDPWYVTLYLEPEVNREAESFSDRETAIAAAHDLAAQFARGEFDYRDLYQVPREDYFERLDELTGRGT
jgi:hypothetical protein